MELASVRIITDNFDPMVTFYELVTEVPANRLAPGFAEFATPLATLAIGHTSTVSHLGLSSAVPASHRMAIIEFRVSDVDAAYARLLDAVHDWVQEPTTMPWGNRSALLRDPDGNLVNLFAPLS